MLKFSSSTRPSALALATTACLAALGAGQAMAEVPTPVGATGAVQLVNAPPSGGEYGRVISSTPVVQQVNVPRQVCTPVSSKEKSGSPAGAIVGAIAGGAIGNAIGHNNGRAAATGLGMLGGAVLGSMIGSEGRSSANQCSTQTTAENRTVAFNVVYEYAGKQYQTQMPKDPGAWVQLQIQPVVPGAVTTQAPVQVPIEVPSAVITQVAPELVTTPVAPVFVHPAAVAPVVVSPQVVYATPYVRPAVALSVPIVVGATRYVQPVTRVVVPPAPVVVYRGHGHGHAHGAVNRPVTQVVEVVAPRTHRPGKVVPEVTVVEVPARPHIKGHEPRYY